MASNLTTARPPVPRPPEVSELSRSNHLRVICGGVLDSFIASGNVTRGYGVLFTCASLAATSR